MRDSPCRRTRWVTGHRLAAVEGVFPENNRGSFGGRYFWVADGLIIRDAGISSMTRVLIGLVENDEFTQVFQRLCS